MLVITIGDIVGGVIIFTLASITLYAFIRDRRRKARERKELF